MARKIRRRKSKTEENNTGVDKDKALVSWEERLSQDAEDAAKNEVVSGGKFFSLQSGVLKYDGNPVPNNKMAVIILESLYENVYYGTERFDRDNLTPPKCFALNKRQNELAPHETVVKFGTAQSDNCAGCLLNAWGSSDTGRGKACRNTRRLAMIPAGEWDKRGAFEMIEDEEHYKLAEMAFMKLPVTSTKGYANYVRQIAGTLSRPPHGVITQVSVVPDNKTQFKVLFEAVEKVPNNLMEIIMQRHEEAKETTAFPYVLDRESEEKPVKDRRRSRKY